MAATTGRHRLQVASRAQGEGWRFLVLVVMVLGCWWVVKIGGESGDVVMGFGEIGGDGEVGGE